VKRALLPDLRTMTIDGRTLSWREEGQGESLVLVHGIGGHSVSWRHQFATFSPNYRVIAWDAPGYGGSDSLPTISPTAEEYATLLSVFLRRLDVDRPHLVGHSLGSIMIAAACHLNRIDAQTLTFLHPVTGSGSLPDSEREPIRLSRIADMERLGAAQFAVQRGRTILSASTPAALVDEAIDVMKTVPKAGYLAAWEMMCRSDIFQVIDSRRPVLIVCGSDDPVCPPNVARSIANKMTGAIYCCLDGVGHYASIEAPDRLESVLCYFLTNRQGKSLAQR
jgi:pimeloyl-ACP methyl ester carboxylesterase